MPTKQCYNGGYCNPDHGSAGVFDICLCPPGYADAGCTAQVTECRGGNWCTNGGTCGVSGTMCTCPIGYSGGGDATSCHDDLPSQNALTNNALYHVKHSPTVIRL